VENSSSFPYVSRSATMTMKKYNINPEYSQVEPKLSYHRKTKNAYSPTLLSIPGFLTSAVQQKK
jgi:hypothetical protein